MNRVVKVAMERQIVDLTSVQLYQSFPVLVVEAHQSMLLDLFFTFLSTEWHRHTFSISNDFF